MREVSRSKNIASRSDDRLGARGKDFGEGAETDEDTALKTGGSVNSGVLFS